jgi:membrane-associated protease RseP (regulator of RpoE activity)
MGLIVGGWRARELRRAIRPRRRRCRPVGIATQIGDIFWNAGPILTLYVAGILSANLALVNVLPFPAARRWADARDRLKRIFGARISLRAEQLTYLVGFIFLFAFIIW